MFLALCRGRTRRAVRYLFAWLAALSLGALIGGGAAAQDPDQPNIIVLLVDDLGWRDVGFMGSPIHRTPHIDRIADEGVLFEAAYANAPNCAPSRAAFMTGMYAPRTGVYTVSPSARGKSANRRLVPAENSNFILPEHVTLAERLKSAGYTTAHVGKWHIGQHEGPTAPTAQGFDVNIAGWRKGHPHSYFSPYSIPGFEDGPNGEYLTDRLTDEAIAFMREHRDEPFFLHFSYYTVHTPIQPREDLQERLVAEGLTKREAGFGAMVGALDESVGRLLAALEELGIDEQTIVAFASDNGGHGGYSDHTPLRGSKGMMFEGGIRIPLAVRWPAQIRPGRTVSSPVLLFDLYPTLVEAAGVPEPQDQPIDGVSLLPHLCELEPAAHDRAIFWHFPAYLEAYGFMSETWRATPSAAIRKGKWKLIEHYETGHLQLFDLDDDPGEASDLASTHQVVLREMVDVLRAWQASVGAQTEFDHNPEYQPRR